MVPTWALPAVICAWAVLGAVQLKTRFDEHLATTGPDLQIVAGPEAAATTARISAGTEAPFGLERSLPEAAGAGIGTLPDRDGIWVPPESAGMSWSAVGAIDGLLTFRGNPTRTFHGRGPVPERPTILWSEQIGCSISSVGSEAKEWCGTGWTGQPAVFPAPDDDGGGGDDAGGAEWWVAVGGYNRSVNFYDPDTGAAAYPRFETGDIIKGTITVDPDGFPLLYTGSRDNYLHIVALDRDEPEELWRLTADDAAATLWNDDWDSSPMVIGDHLFIGGENSRFYIVALNRGYDGDGRVTVDPRVVFSTAGWDDELLASLGDRQVSIENSVAISGNVAYFANSGGLVQGWDFTGLEAGAEPTRVFRFWTGDDTDASVIIDEEGMLYVGSQFERGTARSRELGQVFKLDPSRPDDPLVWSQRAAGPLDTGVWATPALFRDVVIVPTDEGEILGLDRATGDVRWTVALPGPLWSSPVVVDGVLLQGDCEGHLHALDLADTSVAPPELWSIELGGCIESTPAVWQDRIYVGTRSGWFFAIGDAADPATPSG